MTPQEYNERTFAILLHYSMYLKTGKLQDLQTEQPTEEYKKLIKECVQEIDLFNKQLNPLTKNEESI